MSGGLWRAPDKRESGPRGRGRDLENGRRANGDGAQPGANPKPMQLRAWRPLRRNTLRGFVLITAPSLGLDIDDVAVHVKGSRQWASLPGRAWVDPDGNVIRDENGRIKYSSPFRWMTNGLASRFGERVIALLLEHHPHALDGES